MAQPSRAPHTTATQIRAPRSRLHASALGLKIHVEPGYERLGDPDQDAPDPLVFTLDAKVIAVVGVELSGGRLVELNVVVNPAKARQFHFSSGVEDWRVVDGGACAYFRTGSWFGQLTASRAGPTLCSSSVRIGCSY